MLRVEMGTVPYGSLWNPMEPWQEPVTVSKYREAAGPCETAPKAEQLRHRLSPKAIRHCVAVRRLECR